MAGLFSCSENKETEPIVEKKPSVEKKRSLGEGSQAEINMSAEESITQTRKKLDSVFNAILVEYKDNLSFIKNLNHSQNLWTDYMEAQMLVRFPEDDSIRDGSIFNLCWYSYREELLNERINSLQVWLTGIDEHDVCSGSVKTL